MNTKIDDLKQAVVKMIKAGIPVFFGCDVGQSSDRNFGIMDSKLYKFEVSSLIIRSTYPLIIDVNLVGDLQHQAWLVQGRPSQPRRVRDDTRHGHLWCSH